MPVPEKSRVRLLGCRPALSLPPPQGHLVLVIFSWRVSSLLLHSTRAKSSSKGPCLGPVVWRDTADTLPRSPRSWGVGTRAPHRQTWQDTGWRSEVPSRLLGIRPSSAGRHPDGAMTPRCHGASPRGPSQNVTSGQADSTWAVSPAKNGNKSGFQAKASPSPSYPTQQSGPSKVEEVAVGYSSWRKDSGLGAWVCLRISPNGQAGTGGWKCRGPASLALQPHPSCLRERPSSPCTCPHNQSPSTQDRAGASRRAPPGP